MKRKVDLAVKNKDTVADFFNGVLRTHPNKEAIVYVDKQGEEDELPASPIQLSLSLSLSVPLCLSPQPVWLMHTDHLPSNTKTSYTYAEVEAESNKGARNHDTVTKASSRLAHTLSVCACGDGQLPTGPWPLGSRRRTSSR
jgi:hypothetical protein